MKISNTVLNYNRLTSFIALAVFLGLTFFLYYDTKRDNDAITTREFEYRTQEIQTAIIQRMNEYRQVLRSGSGLFKASDTVSHTDWRLFIETLNIDKAYPGIQGVGFTQRILPKDLASHIRKIRREGFPDYKVWPEGQREEYTSIIYLEPFRGRNLRAFGYDMFSEPVRNKAMSEARDSGKTTVSGKVILVQETGKGVQSGFLIYRPLYKKNALINTVLQRRQALLGYVYSPFRVNDLMKGILGRELPDVRLKIYDGKDISDNALMFDSDTTVGGDNGKFNRQVTFKIINHDWTLVFNSLPAFEMENESDEDIIVLIAGIIISVLLSILVRSYSITSARATALSNEIMERQKAEEALSVSEERFRLITESARDLISMNEPDGKYVYNSPSFYSLLGYTPEEMKIKKASDIIHPDDLPFFDDWEASRLYQFRIRKNDGSYLWVEGLAYPIEMQGRDYIIGVAREITERKKAEEELKKQKWQAEVLAGLSKELAEASLHLDTVLAIGTQRTAELIGDASVLMLFADDGACMEPAAVYHSDKSLESKISKKLSGLKIRIDSGFTANVVKSGKPVFVDKWDSSDLNQRIRAEFHDLTARLEPSGLIVVPLSVGRRIIGSLTVFRTNSEEAYSRDDLVFLQQLSERIALAIDNARLHGDKVHEVEERKRTEIILKKTLRELERSNKDLEEFAYVASHDLQEPLRMVSSYTQLISKRYKGKLDIRADEYIAFASEGAQRMQKLIHDLLEYSRVTSKGKKFEPVDTSKILESVLSDLQIVIKENRARITYGSLPVIMGDYMQITRLFQNLISNAIKFRSKDDPVIELQANRTDSEWHFSIKDNGIGIDPEFKERIFVIFQRLHDREEYPGTGIGLAVCKKIIERHGGRIWAEPNSDKGTTFSFTLPVIGDSH